MWLLVGDVDVMPVRYMVLDRLTPAAFDYAFSPRIRKAAGEYEIGHLHRSLVPCGCPVSAWIATGQTIHGLLTWQATGGDNRGMCAVL